MGWLGITLRLGQLGRFVVRWLVAVLACAAGCSGSGTPAAKGREACQLAGQDAWLVALADAKLSTVTELQDVALREEQLGNHDLIKAWCAQHYHG
jgi:hypothetical protein